jgi:hypothetical protein
MAYILQNVKRIGIPFCLFFTVLLTYSFTKKINKKSVVCVPEVERNYFDQF